MHKIITKFTQKQIENRIVFAILSPTLVNSVAMLSIFDHFFAILIIIFEGKWIERML
jgi:predicted membrane-bound dolichyl-phosphate-mannose-protein mannosyltransferase